MNTGRFIQRTSSASIPANRGVTIASGNGPVLKARLRLVRGERGARRNPCGRLSVGIVEVARDARGDPPSLRFLLNSHRGAQACCLYRSPPIGGNSSRY
jgi:hypothetical protein